MLNDFGGGEPAEAPCVLMTDAARKTEQKARGEQIARARGVDDFFDRKRRHRRKADIAAQRLQRRVEIRRLIEGMQFGLVGKDKIDGAAPHQFEKFAAIAIDAKGVRES